MLRYVFVIPMLLFAYSFCLGQNVPSSSTDAERLGIVSFPTSCSPEAQQIFERGLAHMHSFQYQAAAVSFEQAAEKDSHCAMAYWGHAINLYHQLQGPNDRTLEKGHTLIEKAGKISPQTPREREYIQAAAAFYRTGKKLTRNERTKSYAEAMAKVYAHYPKDADAAALYALSVLGSHGHNDAEARKKAIAILEPLFATAPEHPGAAHYLIHAADTPELAVHGLSAARSYAKTAPSSSHALHMPSHIFSLLGLWQDSINSDTDAADAAAEATRKNAGNEFINQIHAMTYLEYGYLQTGREAQALHLIATVKDVPGIPPEAIANFESFMKAIYVLETHRWQGSKQIDSETITASFVKMRVHLARVIEAARAGKPDQASQEVESLNVAHLDDIGGLVTLYPSDPTVLEGEAWLAYAQGKPEEALDKMRTAIKSENNSFSVDSAGVPAYELLGDLLLEMHQPAQALEAYESSLKEAPNRFNSIYGAARSAELAAKQEKAQTYYAALVKIADLQSRRPELAAARTFLAKYQKSGNSAD